MYNNIQNLFYIHKNGIGIRKIQEGDLPYLLELLAETWYGRHRWQFSNMSDQLRWFRGLEEDASRMICVAYDVNMSEFPVGIYKLHHIDYINRCADSSHDVFSLFQGKGYGKTVLECGVDMSFEMLGLYRLNTEVMENNVASQRTASFVGFVQEGVKREAVYRCNERINSLTYGILYKDWVRLDRIKGYEGCCNISYKPKNH